MSVKPPRADRRTFRDLMGQKTPAQIEAATDVSCSTVYRAMRGDPISKPHARLIATELGVTVGEVTASIARTGKARR